LVLSVVRLVVEGLFVRYRVGRQVVEAVRGVDLVVEGGEVLAIVGESGSGKTTLGLAIVRGLPPSAEASGRILLDGVDILSLPPKVFNAEYRWRRIAMVFQGASNVLNPVAKVSQQLVEVIERAGLARGREALELAGRLLREVGLGEELLDRYGFALSGGQKQRVVIAMALAADPDVLILDEPTSALDVVTQAGIVSLIRRLKRRGKAMIFITHDVALAASVADRVAVMYGGKIVEEGPIADVLESPRHPYTEALIGSVPRLRGPEPKPPTLDSPPAQRGCRYWPRCPVRLSICMEEEPKLERRGNRLVACWAR